MEPKRILHYGLSGGLAGIENVVMELYRNIDRTKYQFDFLMMHDVDPYFKEEILSMGGRIYKSIYRRGENPVKGTFWNRQFFHRHKEFYAIHCHVSSLLSIDRILTPYVCKHISKRIIHIHNAGEGKETKKQLKRLEKLKPILPRLATDFITCSSFAGQYNYHDWVPYKTIPNCIDTKKFLFNANLRKEIREKYDLKDKFVIGCIAVMRYQKNHEFLIKIFSEVLKSKPNGTLLLIGEGPLKGEIIALAEKLGIADNIIFLGKQDNVTPFYCAMDLYVMPSRYEGFGLVLLEAQANGLPCVTSLNTVPKEVNVTGNVHFLPLEGGNYELWAEKVLQIETAIYNDEQRKGISDSIMNYHCDYIDYAKKIEKLYEE